MEGQECWAEELAKSWSRSSSVTLQARVGFAKPLVTATPMRHRCDIQLPRPVSNSEATYSSVLSQEITLKELSGDRIVQSLECPS
jgi:hypothetical protein